MTNTFRARLGGSLAVNAAGAAAVFVSQFLIAHFAGVESYGVFAFVFAISQLLVVLSKLGYDSAVQRLIPQLIATEEYQLTAGLLRSALGISLLAGIFGGTALSLWAVSMVEAEQLRHCMYIAALFVPISTLLKILRGILLGLQQPIKAQLLDPLVVYAVWIGIIIIDALRGLELTPVRITAELVLISGAVAIVNLAIAKMSVPRSVSSAEPAYDHPGWAKTAFPMMLAYGLVALMTYTDTILIGILIGTDDAGLYMVSARLASAISMPIAFLGAPLAANVSELSTKKEHGLLQRRIATTARLGFILAVPVAVVIGFGAEIVLGFVGGEFVSGSTVTRILVLAQLVNVAAGPVGLVLMMSGSHIQVGKVLLAMTFVNIALNLVFIPLMGIVGAAIATGCAIVFRNYVLSRQLFKTHALDASAFPRRENRFE